MSFINYATREIQLKIVYYGCERGGKTANLQVIHQTIRDEAKGNLTSLATSPDRTLFFDFMPLTAEAVRGFKTHFQIYTVPGQQMGHLTRRLVLRGADGVVFVVDSQWDKMQQNLESFADLEETLRLQGDALDKIPYILQYNKRDLPAVAPVNYLDFVFNTHGGVRRPSVGAVVPRGEGVFESLNWVARLVLNRFAKQHGGKENADLQVQLA